MTGKPQTNLPNGWKLADLCEVAELNPRLDKSAHTGNPMVSFVPMPRVEAGTGTIDVSQTRSLEEVKKGYTPFREGDVLFAKITPCMENGKMAVVPPLKNDLGFGSTEFHVLRPYCETSAQYVYFFVSSESFRRDAEHNMTGAVGQRRVPTSYLADQFVPVPPAAEQRRIVAKIEELFSELDKGVESLKTARAKLKVYRQAVLKHAFEGKLTVQWRKKNKDTLETPKQLLVRIKRERAVRYERQLKEWKAAVKTWEENGNPVKKRARTPKLEEISHLSLAETETFPSLPAGWSYLQLGLVIDEPKYGSSKKCDYDYKGTGVLRIPNVVRGVVDASDLKGAHFDEDEKRTYDLRSGDILMIRSNGSVSIVGRCALISEAEEQYLYAGYLIRLRSNLATLLPEYFAALMSSHLLRTQIEYKAKSTSGVNNINSREIQSLIVPLCSLSEQEVVVERLSTSLSAINAIEAEIDGQLLKADALRQSILMKAFTGQLIAQDPSDEPASVLLDRIRAERGQTTKRTTRRKTGKRKTARATA